MIFAVDASAVFTIAAFTLSGDQPGWADSTRAAMPEVIGVAIEVPEYIAPSQPVPTRDEKTLTPGAATSGLSQLSP